MPTAVHAALTAGLSLAENAPTRRSIMSCILAVFQWARRKLQPVCGSRMVRSVIRPNRAKALGHHLLRSSILADGELNPREAERVMWDVIVVGTGMGGGMLGYSLAQSGRKVLFVEKGRSTLPGAPGTIRSAIPEVAEPLAARSTETYYDALARAGRSTDEIEDISGRFARRYLPGIGSGTGGSSALYSMVCERFFARDFTPRQDFPRPRRFHRAGGLADHLRPDAALVCSGGEAAGGSRPARSPAPGGGRCRSACGAAVFGRQPAAGRLSGRSGIASLPPADGL